MKPTVEQQAVIEHGTGPALVLADAGSGKTTTILLRIKNLVRQGVPPGQILMITFSRAGTEDMIRRSRELGVPRGVQYRTLHSVGKEMIKRGFPLQEERTFRWPHEDSSEDEGASMTFSIPTEGEEAKEKEKEPVFGQRVGRRQSLDIDIEKLMKATLLNYKDELEAKGPVSRAHLAPKVSEVMKLIDFSKSNLIFPDLIDEATGELFCEGAWSSSDGTKFPCFMDWAWENLRISEDENEPGRIPIVIEAVQRCYMKLQMASACPEYHSSNEYYALHAHRWITFSDMIALPAQAILMGLPWVSPWWGRFSFVIVDEVQDNNLGQWAMVRHLARNNNLMAVGDDSQSIFSFRGARPELMGFYKQELAHSQVYGLSVNFRCPQTVVDQANNLLSHAPNKLKEKPAQALESALPGRITVTPYAEPLKEARGVVKKIQGYQAAGFPSHEIAVIYRTHASAGAVEIELIRNRIPYRVQGSPFFSKPIVAATIGYLGLALEPGDPEWLKACYCKPLRGLNRAFLNKYGNYAAAVNAFEDDEVKQWRWKRGIPNLRKAVTETRKILKEKSVGEAIRHVLWELELVNFFVNRASGDGKIEIEDYASNLEDLGDCYDSAEDLLRYVRLMRDDDIAEADHNNTYLNKRTATGRVVLSTIHRVKGLEYGTVFLIRANEGVIPHRLADLSEERRLFYVAVTRTKSTCEISYVQETALGPAFQSQFIQELKQRKGVRIGREVDEGLASLAQ